MPAFLMIPLNILLVAPVVLPASRQHHFRSVGAWDLDVSKLPPKSHGSADSVVCARRTANVVGLFARSQTPETAPPPRLSPPGSRQKPPARLSISLKMSIITSALLRNNFQIETHRSESVIARNHRAHRILHPAVEEVALPCGQVFYKFPH